MNRIHRAVFAVAGAAAALAVSACSASGGGADTAGNGGPHSATDLKASQVAHSASWPEKTPSSGLAKGLTLPIEQYLESYPQEVTIQEAKYKAIQECMTGFGQKFDPPQPGTNPPGGGYDAANMKRRYGPTDVDDAKQNGYRPPKSPNGSAESYDLDGPDANLAYDLSVPHGQDIPGTLNGRKLPSGGCLGEADRLIGSFDDSLAEEINLNSYASLRGIAEVKDVTTKWESCMKGKHFTDSSPLDAVASAAPDDTAKAVADVDCKKSTNLVQVNFAAERDLQSKAISERQAELDSAKAENDAVVKKAEDYLGRS
jgi:hypothetical protein